MEHANKRQKPIEHNNNCNCNNNMNKHVQIQKFFRMECPRDKGEKDKDKDKEKALFSPRIREVESTKGKPKLLTGRLPEAFTINKTHSPDTDNSGPRIWTVNSDFDSKIVGEMRYTANEATKPISKNTRTVIQRCEITRRMRAGVIVPTSESGSCPAPPP